MTAIGQGKVGTDCVRLLVAEDLPQESRQAAGTRAQAVDPYIAMWQTLMSPIKGSKASPPTF